MVTSMAAFTINDALVKALAEMAPLYEVLFLRGVLTTVAVAAIAWKLGVLMPRLSRKDWGIIILRTGAETGGAFFFFSALSHIPIANITAIMQAVPLTITLAAALVLGEHVGWRRLAAILVGLGGVMLIVRPGASDFTVYSLYGLAAVGLVTVRDLSTRQLAPDTPSFFVTLVTSAAMTVLFGLACLGSEWVTPTPEVLGLSAAAAALLIAGYQFIIMAMRVGEVGAIAPFRYTGLIWALLLGWVAFGEWPSLVTLAGAAIVVASGMFTLLRESRLSRAERVAETSRTEPRGY